MHVEAIFSSTNIQQLLLSVHQVELNNTQTALHKAILSIKLFFCLPFRPKKKMIF